VDLIRSQKALLRLLDRRVKSGSHGTINPEISTDRSKIDRDADFVETTFLGIGRIEGVLASE
jgi:hypothetical protein